MLLKHKNTYYQIPKDFKSVKFQTKNKYTRKNIPEDYYKYIIATCNNSIQKKNIAELQLLIFTN